MAAYGELSIATVIKVGRRRPQRTTANPARVVRRPAVRRPTTAVRRLRSEQSTSQRCPPPRVSDRRERTTRAGRLGPAPDEQPSYHEQGAMAAAPADAPHRWAAPESRHDCASTQAARRETGGDRFGRETGSRGSRSNRCSRNKPQRCLSVAHGGDHLAVERGRKCPNAT
jgi:hypothetical protein